MVLLFEIVLQRFTCYGIFSPIFLRCFLTVVKVTFLHGL